MAYDGYSRGLSMARHLGALVSPRMRFSGSLLVLLVLSVIEVLIAYAMKSAASDLMVSFISSVETSLSGAVLAHR